MATRHDSVGSRVRCLRLKADDLCRDELERLSGLSGGHVSKIEEGVLKNLRIKTILGLQRVLGASADWLISGTGDPPTDAKLFASVKAARAQRAAARAMPSAKTRERGASAAA
jgi:transcriptional regulator with XRE-family HTH domain